MKRKYISFLTPESEAFDPIALAHQTEEIVSQNNSRKYTDFYCTGVYGGISTGYGVGCCLRCVFCWVDWSRDFPFESSYGDFFSPQQAFHKLLNNAKKKGVRKMRISGCEPTLCQEHLLSILALVEKTSFLFVLETNGILLGADPEYADKLKKYKNIHLRVSIKAGTPEGFEKRTGAKGEFYDLPFKAIQNLSQVGASFHAAAMTDPRLMPKEERELLLRKLNSIGYKEYLEEEMCDPYSTTVKRLEKAGFKLRWT